MEWVKAAGGKMEPAQHLLDRLAIREVLDRYWTGEDRQDIDMVLSVFTTDATFGVLEGRDEIAREMRGLLAYRSLHHVAGSQIVEVDGDTASADTMALAFNVVETAGEEPKLLVRGLRYIDQLVRTPQGWRIKHRRGLHDADDGHDTCWQADIDTTTPWRPAPRHD